MSAHQLIEQFSRALCRMAGAKHPDAGTMIGHGSTVPTDGEKGWGKAALFRDSTTGLAYVNEGDADACDFNPLSGQF